MVSYEAAFNAHVDEINRYIDALNGYMQAVNRYLDCERRIVLPSPIITG